MNSITRQLALVSLCGSFLVACSSSNAPSSDKTPDNIPGDPQVSTSDLSGLWLVKGQVNGQLDGSPEHGSLAGNLQSWNQAVYRIEVNANGYSMSLCAGDYQQQPVQLIEEAGVLRTNGQIIGEVAQNTTITFNSAFAQNLTAETLQSALYDQTDETSANQAALAGLNYTAQASKVRDDMSAPLAAISINQQQYSANCFSQQGFSFNNAKQDLQVAELVLAQAVAENNTDEVSPMKAELRWSSKNGQAVNFAEIIANGEQMLVGNPAIVMPQMAQDVLQYQAQAEFTSNGQFTDALSVEVDLSNL